MSAVQIITFISALMISSIAGFCLGTAIKMNDGRLYFCAELALIMVVLLCFLFGILKKGDE